VSEVGKFRDLSASVLETYSWIRQKKPENKIQRCVKNDEAERAQTLNHVKPAFVARIHFLIPKLVNIIIKQLQ
jgi:hypothetical protein